MSKVAVVLNAAAELDEEEQLVARRIAGVLTGAGAELFIGGPAGSGWEVGLAGRRFDEAYPSRALRRASLESTMSNVGRSPCGCGPPGIAQSSGVIENAWLESAGGGSTALEQAIRDGDYRRVVIAGLTSELSVSLIEHLGSKAVVIPLRTPRLANFPRTTRSLASAGSVLMVRSRESSDAGYAGDNLRFIGFALRAGLNAPVDPPHGVPPNPFVLVIGRWSHPVLGARLRRRAARLAREIHARSTTKVVLLTEEFIRPGMWPVELEVRAAGSRRDLWRWMTYASVVIDLDRWRYFGRDAVEAMMCGTPVLVPENSAAHDHVSVCGGGFWSRNQSDLVQMVDTLVRDDRLRLRMSQYTKERARSLFELEPFEERLMSAAMGRG